MIRELLIIGAGGTSREIAGVVDDINRRESHWNLLGFLDDDPARVALAIAEKTGDVPFADTTWHTSFRRAVEPVDPRGPFDWFEKEPGRG